ncbi:DUF885 family protein [Erythrobacter arachoides]|uniref:DUF885 family protein n=1 Tax=Aurantiacibacter arachoides TaxID=1850444 RepID=A0A844ZZK7_9SPHN|nr:DUF885 domain-containing protein [Aurantiacibacter arachoides]MXO92662.1 DUF885 family protein [Aurantiacibacter arachoides]GGD55384.1 hypothetical protein GCM10011411_14250 [Aurantiacibacter arachoides]
MIHRLLPFVLLAGCATHAEPVLIAGPVDARPADQTYAQEDARLLAFLDAAFDAQSALSPEQLTSLGSRQDYDRLGDYTLESGDAEMQLAERQLAQMRAQFDPARLGASARLSYILFEREVERRREDDRFRAYGFPVSTNGTPAGSIPVFLINQHRVETVADARAYIARLRDSERVMRETVAVMEQQAALGIVPPAMVFAPATADARSILTGAPFASGPDNPIWADFQAKVNALDIPDGEKTELLGDARAALTGPFRNGVETLIAGIQALEPRADGNNGAWSLPDGDAYYANRLAAYTTTDLSADQIHTIGLEQVAAIRAEMEEVRREIGFTGTLEEFFAALRSDPAYKYPNTAEGRERYLEEARALIASVMALAPQYFERLPEAALEVRAVEPFRQDTAAVAFYNRPAPDGTRPGIFYVNLADMNQVNRIQTDAIAAHEGAPGHHFQIARAQELQGIPKFRRFGGYSAYTEGWGLYSERLADEMGVYTTPEQRFGMLSLQMWRAIRLVLDTGIHAKRWSREEAIAYFRANSPNSERDMAKEVDRYINNPGQATSYMIGQLRIAELRDRAETELGPRFDIRAFHEAVLGQGALPLDTLETQVDAYIARIKQQS